jgi:hypothetical protein
MKFGEELFNDFRFIASSGEKVVMNGGSLSECLVLNGDLL